MQNIPGYCLRDQFVFYCSTINRAYCQRQNADFILLTKTKKKKNLNIENKKTTPKIRGLKKMYLSIKKSVS